MTEQPNSGSADTHAANLPDQSLEHIFTPIPGSTCMRCSCGKEFGTTSEQNQHRQWHLDSQAIIVRECAKARLEELEAAKANFVGKKYYQDPVEYLEDRTKKLKEEL
jgi:acetone carboxylase gamma subunit